MPNKNVTNSEYYCPQECVSKHYRLNSDGTIINDDIYICPNKKREISKYSPCRQAEFSDSDRIGNCNPFDGEHIDTNKDIISYGENTGLSLHSDKPVNCIGNWSDFEDCQQYTNDDGTPYYARRKKYTIHVYPQNEGRQCGHRNGDIEEEICEPVQEPCGNNSVEDVNNPNICICDDGYIHDGSNPRSHCILDPNQPGPNQPEPETDPIQPEPEPGPNQLDPRCNNIIDNSTYNPDKYKCICNDGYTETSTHREYRVRGQPNRNNPGDVLELEDGSKTIIPLGAENNDSINLYECKSNSTMCDDIIDNSTYDPSIMKCKCNDGYSERSTHRTYQVQPSDNPGDVINFRDGSKTMIPSKAKNRDIINLYRCERGSGTTIVGHGVEGAAAQELQAVAPMTLKAIAPVTLSPVASSPVYPVLPF